MNRQTGSGVDSFRVLHLIDSGGLYGAEKVILSLLAEQRREGMDPILLSAGEPNVGDKAIEQAAERLGIQVVPWRMRSGLNLRQTRRILRWACSQGIGLLHSHGYKFNILMGLWPRPWRAQLPLVCTLHGYVKAPRWSKMAVYEALDRIVLQRADGVALVDKTMRHRLPNRVSESSLCRVIPNGLDNATPKTASLRKGLGQFTASHGVNLIAVGRLAREKGFDTLIQAYVDYPEELANTGVVVFGDGPLRDTFQAQISEAGLDDQIMLVGYADAAGLMPHFDALVMPSRTEGLPMTVLEALRAELPIIATRVGGVPAALDGLESALLVEPERPDQIANAVAQFTASNDHGRHGHELRQRFVTHYSASAMAEGYRRLYEDVLLAAPPSGPTQHHHRATRVTQTNNLGGRQRDSP